MKPIVKWSLVGIIIAGLGVLAYRTFVPRENAELIRPEKEA